MKRQSGFTVLELIVTVCVIGILTAIAVPNFSVFREGFTLNSVAWEFIGAVQKIRLEAVKANKSLNCRVGTGVAGSYAFQGGDEAFREVQLPPGYTLETDIGGDGQFFGVNSRGFLVRNNEPVIRLTVNIYNPKKTRHAVIIINGVAMPHFEGIIGG